MRVTRRPTTTIPGVGGPSGPSEAGDAAPATSGRGVTDRVQLSDAARLRQRLKAEIGDPTAASDPGRLDALRAEVVNETYAPDPRAVASRLLGELAADALA